MKNICFFFILFIQICFAQKEIVPKYSDSIALVGDFYYGKDNFDIHYYSKNDVLYTTNNMQYQNISLGKIENVCLTNALQIIVFYSHFNTIVLLDNQLNEIQKIDGNLFENPVKIDAFGLANQNRVWLYDDFSQKICLYDYKNNSLNYITTPLNQKIKYYASDFNSFLWVDDTNSFFSSTIFGKITKIGECPKHEKMTIIDHKTIFYSNENELFLFDFEKSELKKIKLNEKSFYNFFYSNGILTIFTHNQITNYKLEELH